MNCGENVER